jgi:transketolase
MLASQRKAYAEALVQNGETDSRIVVLEADLGKSTMSILFERRFPERYLEMGIAEANMVSVAAGLSLSGKIPFINTFAVFAAGRAYDQIRQSICIASLQAVVVGSSAGLSDFGDGATHQPIEDLALMRALPNMTVFSPADAVEAKEMVAAAIAHNGPVYIRICKSDMPVILDPSVPYKPGKMIELREDGDIAVFVTGWMVHVALDASKRLADEGIAVSVVNVGCIKPLDTETLLSVAGRVRGIVTAEEHSVIGGLGSAICEALAGKQMLPVEIIGIRDVFGCSAHTHEELLAHYGLTEDAIIQAVKKIMNTTQGISI